MSLCLCQEAKTSLGRATKPKLTKTSFSCTETLVEIVWDPRKYLANLDNHEGLDFKDLTTDFFAEATVYPVKHRRYMALGELGKRTLAVVFIPLGTEAISVISMRYASKAERKLR